MENFNCTTKFNMVPHTAEHEQTFNNSKNIQFI